MPGRHRYDAVALGGRLRQGQPDREAAELDLDLDRLVLTRPESLLEAEPPVEGGGAFGVGHEQDHLGIAEAHSLIVPDPGGRCDGHPLAGRSRTRRQLLHLRAQWTHRASRDWNTYVAATIAERTTRGLSANTARFR